MVGYLILAGVIVAVVAPYCFSVMSRKTYRCPRCGERLVGVEYMSARRCGMCGAPLERQLGELKMKREDLLAGTRPAIRDGKIIMTGAEGFDGYEIMEYKGMVRGISVRAKDMGQDCAMGCKQMVGGELSSYSQFGDESRQRSIDLMLEMAGRQGANGVINVEFELTGASQGASQVVVHGTAVIIKPIINYVPTGAVGNILADMLDSMEGKQS